MQYCPSYHHTMRIAVKVNDWSNFLFSSYADRLERIFLSARLALQLCQGEKYPAHVDVILIGKRVASSSDISPVIISYCEIKVLASYTQG